MRERICGAPELELAISQMRERFGIARVLARGLGQFAYGLPGAGPAGGGSGRTRDEHERENQCEQRAHNTTAKVEYGHAACLRGESIPGTSKTVDG
jgi:hypothetical protein